jgi:hypothetical protein
MATASMAGAVKASYPVHAPCPHEITCITRPAVCASAGPWQWPPCVGPGRGTGSRTEEPTWLPLAGRRHVVDMLRAGRYGDRCDRFHPAGMIDRLLLAATCNSRHSAVMTRSSIMRRGCPLDTGRHANSLGDDAFRSLLDLRQQWQHASRFLIVVRKALELSDRTAFGVPPVCWRSPERVPSTVDAVQDDGPFTLQSQRRRVRVSVKAGLVPACVYQPAFVVHAGRHESCWALRAVVSNATPCGVLFWYLRSSSYRRLPLAGISWAT